MTVVQTTVDQTVVVRTTVVQITEVQMSINRACLSKTDIYPRLNPVYPRLNANRFLQFREAQISHVKWRLRTNIFLVQIDPFRD